jgi:hypothetical protein
MEFESILGFAALGFSGFFSGSWRFSISSLGLSSFY